MSIRDAIAVPCRGDERGARVRGQQQHARGAVACACVRERARRPRPLADLVASLGAVFRCKQWVELCQNDKVIQKFKNHGSSQVSKSFRICSEHFKREDYVLWTSKKK